ncbi:MAG TPA: hypothetical protein PK597_07760 [Oscillospiraceae bacterium]|nr:hypothetical protein [Oscillospiraceae bacterium]
MYLEQEAYGLIKGGFICVIAAAALVFTFLYWKSRNRHLLWFCGQAAFLTLAFHFFFSCVTYLPHQGNAMYSEDQTLTIALAGLCWAASMLFMFVGIYRLLKKQDVIYQF